MPPEHTQAHIQYAHTTLSSIFRNILTENYSHIASWMWQELPRLCCGGHPGPSPLPKLWRNSHNSLPAQLHTHTTPRHGKRGCGLGYRMNLLTPEFLLGLAHEWAGMEGGCARRGRRGQRVGSPHWWAAMEGDFPNTWADRQAGGLSCLAPCWWGSGSLPWSG